jgi:hypothetical protein
MTVFSKKPSSLKKRTVSSGVWLTTRHDHVAGEVEEIPLQSPTAKAEKLERKKNTRAINLFSTPSR